MASDVNIIISVQNLASKQLHNIAKSLGALHKKVDEVSKNTQQKERETARVTETSHKRRQASIKGTISALESLRRSTRFLYSGSITTGLFGTAGLLGAFKIGELGAQADQIRVSFLNTFGSKSGSILNSVRTSVKGIVDDVTLMKEAIKANMAGIRDSNMLPEIFKLGAVASQRLGIEASQGMDLARKAIVEFNEGAMEQLGIINKLDPTYKTQMAIINKSTKGLGQYLTTQFKLNYVLEQARKRFGANFDVLEDNRQAFQFLNSSVINLKNNISFIVADALAPLARGFGFATSSIIQFVQQLREDKAFKDGTVTLIKFVTALSGMVSLLGVAKLAFMAVGAIFSGPFGLLGGFLTLAAAMKLSTLGGKDFMDNLKKLGQVALGVFQLLSSYDPKTGLAQINKELANAIGPQNMKHVLGIAHAIESVISFIKGFADGASEAFKSIYDWLKKVGLLSNSSFDTWEQSGKIIGKWAVYLASAIAPLSILVGMATSLAGTLGSAYLAMKGIQLLNISGGFLGKSLGIGTAVAEGSLGTVLGLGAAGAGGYFTGKALVNEFPKLGTAIGDYAYDAISSNNSTYGHSGATRSTSSVPTATAQSSLQNMGIPVIPQVVPSTMTKSQGNDTLAPILHRIANHLNNIDDKTNRRNAFEDRALAGSH